MQVINPYHPPHIAFTENLSAELSPLNIRTLLVEPGTFRTEGIYSTGWCKTHPFTDYDTIRESARKAFESIPGNEPGDAFKAMTAVVDVVRGEGFAQDRAWPGYLVLGEDGEAAVRNKCAVMLGVLDEWKDLTRAVSFD
jgi:NAD(P)-dependent dehydrogenase (short-subunit alcohol dehydrogenase family)